MRIKSTNRRLVLTVILIAVVFVSLGLPSQAKAEDEQVNVIQRKMAGTMYSALVITNQGISALVNILQATLYFKIDAEFPVVKDMWKIVRDFANMLFIIVLIAVAMGTVFNVKSFGFGDLDLGGGFLMQFLIAALLINFSLTIGGLIINGTQVINDTFLSSIGNFQDRLGSVLNPKVLIGLPADASDSRADKQFSLNPLQSNLTQNMVIQLFFTLILAVILLFSLLVPVVFTLARIPMLMILLVFAPGAWLLGILPGTRKFSSQWWSQFWGWNLFLPFYLLVLYFGLYFLSYQKTILESIDRTAGADVTGFANLTLSTIFFYFVAAMVFVMGTAAAAKASWLGGTSAGRVAGWARGKVGGWWFGGRFATGAAVGAVAGGVQGFRGSAEKGVGGRILETVGGTLGGARQGLFSSKDVAEAIQKRGKEKFEEIKKEGLPTRVGGIIYGGTRKGAQFGAQVGQFLGTQGAVAGQLRTDVADFKKKFEASDETPEELRRIIKGPSTPAEKLAAYELLKSKKVISAAEISKAYEDYGNFSGSERLGTTFALDIDYEKMSKAERALAFEKIKNKSIQRKIAKAMAEKEDLEKITDIEAKMKVFDSWDDMMGLVGKIKKKHIAAALDAKVNVANAIKDGSFSEVVRGDGVDKVKDNALDEIKEEVSKLNNDRVVELDAGDTGLKDERVQAAFGEVFSNNIKRAVELAPRLSKKQRLSFDKAFEIAREANKGKLEVKLTEKEGELKKLRDALSNYKSQQEKDSLTKQIENFEKEEIKPLKAELKTVGESLQ